jgi:hypothetical protein
VSDLFEPDVLDSLLRQWSRSLRARNRSARTIETYTDTAEHLAAYARKHDHADLDRALIEDYLADLADRWKPGTVAFRYRSLQQFTKWLAAEGELDADPMEGMRAPHVPEEPVPILTPDDPHRENLGQPGPAPGQLQCPALLTQGQQQVPDQHRPRCPGRGRADQDAGRDVVHGGRGDVTQGRRAAGARARGACTRPAGYGRRRCGARSSRGRRPGSRRRCVLRPWPR